MQDINICNNIEVHALDYGSNFSQVVPIALEHGFSGIVTMQGRVSSLNKIVLDMCQDKQSMPKIIAAVDHPFGSESIDARAYQIHSSKEQGASVVEMVSLYRALADGDVKEAIKDLDSICTVASRCGIELRYVMDVGCPFISHKIRDIMSKELSIREIGTISTSLGFYDRKISDSDHVLWLRDIKKISGCKMKAYVDSGDTDSISTIVKSGAEIIGLDWQDAAWASYEYEALIKDK